MFFASALTLLSIRSAIAVSKEYPSERMDSISRGAYGVLCFIFMMYIIP
jgi:hypothetical protein